MEIVEQCSRRSSGCNKGSVQVQNETGEVIYAAFKQGSYWTYWVMVPGTNENKYKHNFPEDAADSSGKNKAFLYLQRGDDLVGTLGVYEMGVNWCFLSSGDIDGGRVRSQIPGFKIIDSVRKGSYPGTGPCWSVKIIPVEVESKTQTTEPTQEQTQLRALNDDLTTHLMLFDQKSLVNILNGCVVRFRDIFGKYYGYTEGNPLLEHASAGFLKSTSETNYFTLIQAPANDHMMQLKHDSGQRVVLPSNSDTFSICSLKHAKSFAAPKNIEVNMSLVSTPILKNVSNQNTLPFDPLRIVSGMIPDAFVEFFTLSDSLISSFLKAYPFHKMRCCMGDKSVFNDINLRLCMNSNFNTHSGQKNCEAFMENEWCAAGPDIKSRKIECMCYPSAPIEDDAQRQIIEGLAAAGIPQSRKCIVSGCKDGTAFLNPAEKSSTCSNICLQIQNAVASGDYSKVDFKGQQTMDCSGSAPIILPTPSTGGDSTDSDDQTDDETNENTVGENTTTDESTPVETTTSIVNYMILGGGTVSTALFWSGVGVTSTGIILEIARIKNKAVPILASVGMIIIGILLIIAGFLVYFLADSKDGDTSRGEELDTEEGIEPGPDIPINTPFTIIGTMRNDVRKYLGVNDNTGKLEFKDEKTLFELTSNKHLRIYGTNKCLDPHRHGGVGNVTYMTTNGCTRNYTVSFPNYKILVYTPGMPELGINSPLSAYITYTANDEDVFSITSGTGGPVWIFEVEQD